MFIDASVLLAILLREPEANGACAGYRSSAASLHVARGHIRDRGRLMRKMKVSHEIAQTHLDQALAHIGVEIVTITEEVGYLASEAFERYGKGRGHPAQLNMGDCFAYACAKAHGTGLLHKGGDFSSTDLALRRG